MKVFLKHYKYSITIFLILFLFSACAVTENKNQMDYASTGDRTMSTSLYSNLIEQCKGGDNSTLNTLLPKLKDMGFLNSIEVPRASGEYLPLNLKDLLICIASNTKITKATQGLTFLFADQLYQMSDPNSAKRRKALILSSGHLLMPDSPLIKLLRGELTSNEELNRNSAIEALARLAAPSSILALQEIVFNQESKIQDAPTLKIIYHSATITIAQFRDKPEVFSFLLNVLFNKNIHSIVEKSITEDKLKRGPDKSVPLAPLEKETENSVELAKILGFWIKKNKEHLFEWRNPVAFASRFSKLLGIKFDDTKYFNKEEINAWLAVQFHSAAESEKNEVRKALLQKALNEMKVK